MLLERIQKLKKAVIEQANLAEKMISTSMEGLLERDVLKLDLVFQMEEKINENELAIEEDAISLIAMQKPEAKNLRIILMIIAMNNDLERIGDQAVNIAQCANYLITKPTIKKLIDIPSMAEETQRMLRNTIKAFIEENIVLAKQVCINDDIVDNFKEQIYRDLITIMIDDPACIKRAFFISSISANLERIADIATNIAEETIYMTEGRVIKHNVKKD
jgi:phosphate transport system protein